MSTLLLPDQSQERMCSSNSGPTISGRPPGRQGSLNLLGKTLPIPVATAPQLRTRRQFSFNGMWYETGGIMQQQQQQKQQKQQHQQQQRQESWLRTTDGTSGSGGGTPASRELRMRGGGNSTIIGTTGTNENAGGDNSLRSDHKRTVPSKRVNRDMATPRLNRSNHEVQMKAPSNKSESGSRLSKTFNYSSRTKVKDELNDKDTDLGRRRFRSQQQLQSEGTTPLTPRPPNDGYGARQRLMFAQSLKKANNASGSKGGTPTTTMAIGSGGMPSKMDYITLTGLVLGCMASHVLYFLCWYFSWLKNQVVGLRKRFLGHANLWEFFDLDDNSRYSVQTKLLLAPLIIAGALLYCVVNMLHLLVQVVRSDVPRTVVVFVQRVANSGLLGTITMGLGGGGGGLGVGAFKRRR